MTLAEAQAAFRHAPGRATALAYLDAAIRAFERDMHTGLDLGFRLHVACQEIRDWLMNEPVPEHITTFR